MAENRKVGRDTSVRWRPDPRCEPLVSSWIIRNLRLDATVVGLTAWVRHSVSALVRRWGQALL